MLAALARLHLDGQPQQVAALAAFIEQIGPEPRRAHETARAAARPKSSGV